jgi:hypothetical protein
MLRRGKATDSREGGPMSSELYAGVARRIVNPMLGIRRIGPRIYGDPIQAIASDLTAAVCVLSNHETTIAILALDLCEMIPSVSTAIRVAVGDAIGVPVSHVLLNMSHNHSAPALPGYSPDTPEQQGLKERYCRDLTQSLVDAAVEAHRGMKPARIGAGWGESDIGVYRRETGPDGRDILGEVPEHPIDRSVGVIRVDDLDGGPIAILFSFGCHAVVVGPRSMVAATDYPGPARKVVEASLGGIAMFLQACGGNVNPRVGIGYEIDGRDNERRVGAILGSEALKVAADLRTNMLPGPRTTFGSVPSIMVRTWEAVEGPTCTFLGASEEVVELDYIALPPLEEAVRIQENWSRILTEKLARGAQDWEIRVARMYAEWSQRLVAASTEGRAIHNVIIQAVRINEIAIAGLSMEAFFETGLAVKRRSPVAHTQVLGYTNGSTGYLPRKEDYPPAGWKLDETYHVPDLYVQAYMHPVALHPDSEQIIVERLVALIASLPGAVELR